jgi:gliding motility-associated lipoprotein GldH
MVMKNFWVIVVLFSVISCSGGDKSDSFEKIIPLENQNWQRFNNLDFEVPVKRGDMLDFYLLLKYNNKFNNKRLPVNITFYTPGGEIRSRNFSFWIKDKRTGAPLGTTENNVTSLTLNIRKEMPFITDGICKVSFEKKIPRIDTYGIISVGLKAVKSDIKNEPEKE